MVLGHTTFLVIVSAFKSLYTNNICWGKYPIFLCFLSYKSLSGSAVSRDEVIHSSSVEGLPKVSLLHSDSVLLLLLLLWVFFVFVVAVVLLLLLLLFAYFGYF